MNKKALIIILCLSTVAVGAIFMHNRYRKKMTTSADPDKNERKIVLVSDDSEEN